MITWSPDIICDGDQVAVNATIVNNGTDNAADFYVRFEVDGNYIGREIISGLSVGANIMITQNWLARAGSHNITVYVDEYNVIEESDDINNKMTADLPFIQFPDLTVTNISWTPTDIVGGDTVTFTATVTNIGAGSTSSDFYVRFEVDGKQIGKIKVADGLDSGSSTEVTQSWTATWASTINVSVDEDGVVTESDETNNRMSNNLPGLPFPDLIVTGLTWEPKENVNAGDSVTFTATIENAGGRFHSTMSKPLKIAFLINAEYVGSRNIVGGIRTGQPLNTTFTWSAQPGTNPEVCVVADYSNMIPESNENNNELCETLTLAIKSPDLTITQLTFEPTGSIHVGDTVQFTAEVANIGAGDYNGDFDIGFYVGDVYAGVTHVANGVPAGESIFSTFNWTASSCSDPVIKAKADFFDNVRESDKANNEKTEILPASVPYADLEITGINWSPGEDIKDRDPVTFNVTVKNRGPGTVVTDFKVYFDIDGYFTRTNVISDGLAAGKSKTTSFTWKATPGDGHDATAKADPDNVVPESDKANNERVQLLPFNVSLVEIFEVRVEPVEITTGIGGQTSCRLKINNYGSASSNFDITVAGLDQSWYILSGSSIFLSAGEEGIIDLAISVPEECENSGTFPFHVSVTSQETGITKEGSATLIVEPTPILHDLLPHDRASLGSDDITFSGNTYINATTTIYLKAEDEVDYTPYTGAAGQIHTVVASNLARNRNYTYYAESASPCGTFNSSVRAFYIGNGISFTREVYEFTVEKDYNQRVTIRVQNTDNEYHELLVEVPITYDDLVLGFVGDGSQDNIIPLNPGESKDVTLAIQCADAQKEDYELIAALTSTKGDAILTDTTRIKLHVHVPRIDYNLDEISVDPITLTKTFKLTNKGDPITDLTISPADNLKENAYIEPSIEHFRLDEGASIEFDVVPILSSPDFRTSSEVVSALSGVEAASSPPRASGDMMITAGGVSVATLLSFAIPVGKNVHRIEVSNVIWEKHINTWFCNNRPNIEVWWDMVSGIQEDKVILDPLIIKFDAQRGWDVKPHDVYISVNGHEVGSLINTVPEGYYKFDVDPSFLIYTERGVSRNCIVIHTVHQNGGHYVVGSDIQVHLDLKNYTTHLVASSQEEANQIALDNLPPGFHKAPDSINIEEGGVVSLTKGYTALASSTTEVLLGEPTTLQATTSPNLLVWAEFDNGDAPVYLAEVGSGGYNGEWTPSKYPGSTNGMCVITINAKGPGDGDDGLLQGQFQRTVKIVKPTKLEITIDEPTAGKKISQIERLWVLGGDYFGVQPVKVTVTDDVGAHDISSSDVRILGRVVITKADKTTTVQQLSNWISEGNGKFRCDWTPECPGEYEIFVYAHDLSDLVREDAKASVTGTLEEAELKITVSGGLSGTIDPYKKYYTPNKDGQYIQATWNGGLYNTGAKVPDFPVTLTVNKEATGFFSLTKDKFVMVPIPGGTGGLERIPVEMDRKPFDADPDSPATYNINIKMLDPGEYYLWVKADAVNVPGIEWIEDESIRFTIERKPIFFPGRRTSAGSWIWQATAMPEGPKWSDLSATLIQPVGILFGPVTGVLYTLGGYASTASLDNYYIIVEWEYTPFEWDEVRKNYIKRSAEWEVAEGNTLKYQRHLRYSAERHTVVGVDKSTYDYAKWVLTAKGILFEYTKYVESNYGAAVKWFVIALDTAIAGQDNLATITKYKFAETKWWGVPDVWGGGYTGYDKFGPRPPLADLSTVLQPGAKEHGYWRDKADLLYPQTRSMQVTASTVTSDLLPVSVDSGVELITFGIRWDTDSGYFLDLILQAPNGDIIDPSSATLNENISHTRFATDYIYDLYAIRNPQPGEWTLKIDPINVSIEDADYSVLAIAKTDLTCSFFTNKDVYSPGENITLMLYLIDIDELITNATVQVNIYPPDGGMPDSLALYDDGNHDDGLANDGTYGNTYTSATMEGSYYISGVAKGTTYSGEPFSKGFAYEVFMQDEPLVYIESLEEGMVVQGTVNIYVSAEDNSGTVSRYEIWIDDVKVSDTNIYVWNTVSANGLHTITARASDAEGNTGTVQVDITVSNPPETGDVTPPSAPVDLEVRVDEIGNTLALSWNPNTESDLAGYNVYRSMTSGGTYAKINVDPVTDITYKDDGFQGEGLEGGREYYYVISAIDTSWLESDYSLEVNGTPLSSWIDYFNDKTGIDVSASSNITVANGTVFLCEGNTRGYIISKPIHPTSILSWGYIFWLEDLNDQNTMMEISQDGINWQTVVKGADISSLNPSLPLYYKYTMLSDETTRPVLYVLRVSYATIANPVGFSDVYADRGLDSDMDGLFDYLVIDAGVDVGISGDYYLKGALKGGSDDSVLIHFNSSYYISEVDSTVQLLFNGETIYQHGVSGPYILANLELLDANHNQIDSRAEAYTTSTYTYTDFERPPAEFNDNYFDMGTDTDGDGLYNTLTVSVGINVTAAGNYMVIGTLEDNDGYEIVEASNSSELEEGSPTMSLEFRGTSIRKQGVDGPYYLRNHTLFYQDEASRQIGYRSQAYTTTAYTCTDFQKPPVAFIGIFSDRGTDIDSDGKYDYLTVDIDVDVENGGEYNISGRLEDVNGSEIVIATSTVNIAGKQTVQLNFDGLIISGHGMNGPYKIKALLIYSVEDGSLFDFLSDACTTTSEYNYSDFPAPPLDLTLSPTDLTFSNDAPEGGEQITISATIHNDGTVDANGVVVQFFDGNPDAGGVQIETDQTITRIAHTETAQVTWTAIPGTHDIFVRVDPYDSIQEANENNNQAHKPITIEPTYNQPPIASFTYSPLNPVANKTITFNASNSYDHDGFIVNYEWEFGDAIAATGEIVEHSYSKTGDYTVILRVTDNASLSNTNTMILTVTTTTSVETAVCGDVTGDINVTMADARRIVMWLSYPEDYPIHNLWAADVTGDGTVTMADARRIVMWLSYPYQYPLTCSPP